MTQTGFIAAMAADLAYAAYDLPIAVERSASEWVIVSIWGNDREFLTLSRTGTAVQGEEAPPGLQPCLTHLGILLSRVDLGEEETSEYLLMRNRPADIPVGGMFYPTDGFVRLTLRDGLPSLTGHGRFAHSAGTLGGLPVVQDVPDPSPGAQDARAWHLTATRRPWIGEFAPAARPLIAPAIAARAQASRHKLAVLAAIGASRIDDAPDDIGVVGSSEPPAHLAPSGPAPHTRRRKRPEAKHGVTTEA